MAAWIDSVTPHNPVRYFHEITLFRFRNYINLLFKIWHFHMQVWLARMDGHMGLANTLALTLAGISRNNENPNGGAIIRNNDGGNTFFIFIYHFAS